MADFFSVFHLSIRVWKTADGLRKIQSPAYTLCRNANADNLVLPSNSTKDDLSRYVPKPYEQMQYPGQRVQVDVKFVPKACHVGEAEGKQFYQYTAIDEYSRFRYVEAFEEHSTYSSAVFLTHMLRFFKFRVECVQTDNSSEFTNRFTSEKGKPTLFEKYLARYGIRHKLIKPYTPRHNGKVERSHRKDNEYFYASHMFYSLKDFAVQLAVHNRRYNNFPMKSPREVMTQFLGWG